MADQVPLSCFLARTHMRLRQKIGQFCVDRPTSRKAENFSYSNRPNFKNSGPGPLLLLLALLCTAPTAAQQVLTTPAFKAQLHDTIARVTAAGR